ncbi:hypothetical protein [Metabacillus litoralis]|uniref:hypothetical protein n=1 Tax=Metabacillus litoralis TaxID=152268 RepID=UPI001CFD4943|nr:hypothetical protein [Metabacillus litoralis]
MKNKQTDKQSIYRIREKNSVYVDRLCLIGYLDSLVLSWNIVDTTKNLVMSILKEEYKDLLVRILLYCKNGEHLKMTDFPISKDAGVITLKNLPTGLYYCELVVTNSQNDSITIKHSNEVNYLFNNTDQHHTYRWLEVIDMDKTWKPSFSGYTNYE